MMPGKWIDTLTTSINEFMRLETTDGVHREGRITGFTYRKFEINGDIAELPIEIEINGDPSDRVPLDRVLRMTIG